MSLGKRPVSGQEVGAGLPPRFRPARLKEGHELGDATGVWTRGGRRLASPLPTGSLEGGA